MNALIEITNEGLDAFEEPAATCRGCGTDVNALEFLQRSSEELFIDAPERYPWFNPSILRETQTLLLNSAMGVDEPENLAPRIIDNLPVARAEINRLNRACEIDICPECRAEYMAAFGEEFSTSTPPKTSDSIPSRCRRRLGRPADTDPVADRRIAEAWRTRRHESHQALGDAIGITKREVQMALDRHRKRVGKTPHRKSRQEH
jgi:hypothetical protein